MVVLIGVSHTGPKAYYDDIKKEVLKLWKSHPDLVVLDEFNKCRSSSDCVLVRSDNSKLDLNLVLSNQTGEPSLNSILQLSPGKVQALVDSGFLKWNKCKNDRYKNNFRHPQIVFRNKKICKAHHAEGSACQFEDFTLPLEITRVDSDALFTTNQDLGEQVITSLMYPNEKLDSSYHPPPLQQPPGQYVFKVSNI